MAKRHSSSTARIESDIPEIFDDVSQHIVRVSNDDQSIWNSGPRSAVEWSEYFPIIGGERKHFTVENARLVDGAGKVTVDGERIEWDPEGKYDSLANGAVKKVVIAWDLVDENGQVTSKETTIEARGTKAGTGYVNPTTGETGPGALTFAAVSAAEILQDAHHFDTIKPIDIQFDLQDALGDVLDDVLGGLRSAADAAARNVDRAYANHERVSAEWEAATEKAGHINKVTGLVAAVELAKAGAVTARGAYDAAKAAKDALDKANIEKNAALAAKAAAQVVFDGAEGAVDLAEDAVNGAKNAVAAAAGALNSAIDVLADATNAVKNAFEDFWAWIKVGVGLQDKEDAARDAKNRAQIDYDAKNSALASAQNELNKAKVDFSEAKDALNKAEAEVNKATAKAASALDDFLDKVGTSTLSGLDFLADQAEAAHKSAQAELNKAVAEMRADGYFINDMPDLGDLASANAEVVKLAGEKGLAYADIGIAETAKFAADALLAGVDGTNVTADVEVAIDAYAQAGLQVDFELDGGSVDTDIDFDLTSRSRFDAEDDTFTIAPKATNATTGESVAFQTVSPNMKFYAGIAYHAGATFDMLVDLFAEVGGLELLDFPGGVGPYTLTKEFSIDGFIDLIDFDSTEFDGFDIEFPGFMGDILSAELNFPTVETKGRAQEFDAGIYKDVQGFDIDALANAILNIAEMKFDYSPEFRAMLIERGMEDDLFSDDFGQALVDAMAIVLETLTGEGDTDGDGVVPIFMIDGDDGKQDAIFHIDSIKDDLSGLDLPEKGKFGFFVGSAASENMVQINVDIDQLVATAVNVALGNSPETTINPLDLSIGIGDIFEKAGVDKETREKIAKFIELELSAELADFDVRAGANFSQEFALSVDDIEYQVTFEDGTTETFSANKKGRLVVENASELVDTNGDGDIDYTLSLKPVAEFFNDTEIGLNVGYTLDLIKSKLEMVAKLPLSELFPELDLPDLPGISEEFTLGPVLRLDGDVDVLSADIFEKRFDFDAGMGEIEGSFVRTTGGETIDQVEIEPTIEGSNKGEKLRGTQKDDVIDAKGGDDKVIGRKGADIVLAGEGDDYIVGHKDDDVLSGEEGADTFYFRKGHGADVITDFEIGTDLIEIGKGAKKFGQLDFDQQGDDVVVSFNNVEITVQDVLVADLADSDNFLF